MKYMRDIFGIRNYSKQNKEGNEGERIVEVSEDVINELHAAHYFFKRKERDYLCI